MNQTCRVCGEVAAGYHFGAFTCEGCKSFFGRTYNNRSSIGECKNNNSCVINKKNRTSCKSCRLKKCFTVGMSKSGSRYGRRSNWFKIHCLLQDQQQQAASLGAQLNGTQDSDLSGVDMVSLAAANAEAARDLTTSANHHNQNNHQPPQTTFSNHHTSSIDGQPILGHQATATFNHLASSSPGQQLAGLQSSIFSTAAAAAAHQQAASNPSLSTAAALAAASAASANGNIPQLPDNSNSQLYQSALAQLLFCYMVSQQQQPQQI